MSRRIPSASSVLRVACLAGLAACTTTEFARNEKVKTDPWIEPSLVMREQINDQAARLPWTHGVDRIETINWFASVGEPAYRTLLNLAHSSNPVVSGSALAALGATGDSRLVPYVQALNEQEWGEQNDTLQLEHARTLMRLGDWSKAPTLIRGLTSEDAGVRALSIQALRATTGLDFGFAPRGSDSERAEAVRRWEEWWQRRSGDEVLIGRGTIPATDPVYRRGSQR